MGACFIGSMTFHPLLRSDTRALRAPPLLAAPRAAFASSLLGLVTALAWPSPALAEGHAHAVSPGLYFGVTFGERTMATLGLDLRYTYLSTAGSCPQLPNMGFGPFGQAALVFYGGGVAGRFALGAHGGG